HVAPHLAADRRVVAINLTGHGGSGTRDEYDFPTWADEVVAVAESAGGRRRYVIGHSMGGVAALTTAYRHVDRLDGTVLVDPPEWLVTEDGLPPRRLVLPPRRFHPDRATAAARFRARPPDPARLPFVEEYVAERSVHETSEGWTWRFDHEVTLHGGFPVELWGGPLGPMVVVLAERSLLSAEERAELVGRLGAG